LNDFFFPIRECILVGIRDRAREDDTLGRMTRGIKRNKKGSGILYAFEVRHATPQPF